MTLREPMFKSGAAYAGIRSEKGAVKRIQREYERLEARISSLEAMFKSLRDQAIHAEKANAPKRKPKAKPPKVDVYDPHESYPGKSN